MLIKEYRCLPYFCAVVPTKFEQYPNLWQRDNSLGTRYHAK